MLEAEARHQDVEWLLEKISAAKKPKPPPAPKIQPKAELAAIKEKEFELWKTWDKGGRKPADLHPLLKSFAKPIQKRVNIFKNRVEVPTSFIEHVHKVHFVNALKTYDPKKGTLGTWVGKILKKAGRDIQQNQNFARITENISKNIGYYNALKSELHEKLGHEPSAYEIHDHLLITPHYRMGSLSLKNIQRLEREQRRALVASDRDVEEIRAKSLLSSRAEEVKGLIVHELTKEELPVHEYTFGLNGRPMLKPGEIARKLKIDNSKVSKLRKSIWTKMSRYLEPENV